MFIFRTPVRNPQGPRVPTIPNPTTEFDDGGRGDLLMRHIHHHGGYPVAVMLVGGVIVEKSVPTQVEMAAATTVWMGGRDNVVSVAEKTVLEAAGYSIITV